MASKTCQSILILLSTLIFLSQTPSHSADPDPLQDFCIADLKRTRLLDGFPCKLASKVTSDDFFYSGLRRKGNTSNSLASSVTPGNVLSFPGLNTLGISMNRVDLDIGGKVLVGLITTRNELYMKNLTAGEMFVAPRGLLHFQLNVGPKKALIITAFNSQLPGSVVVSTSLFGSKPSVPDDVLTKAFRVEKSVVDEIKSKFI
ncbi:germin-like protein subfamily t member 1 [Phtheirospermum japonicum]|uniref:Germin-like protein n=1 Tax=Phtheirospermum japonicum TaxID=374723 RepID=A0A830B4Q2_9LAMI|nr:germin-like protein subfamily t member 1 [Phtheirospermum japonicum]